MKLFEDGQNQGNVDHIVGRRIVGDHGDNLKWIVTDGKRSAKSSFDASKLDLQPQDIAFLQYTSLRARRYSRFLTRYGTY